MADGLRSRVDDGELINCLREGIAERDDELEGLAARIAEMERLVAKYKWQRDECADELGRKLAVDYEYEATKPFAASDVIVDLNRRWEEHNA